MGKSGQPWGMENDWLPFRLRAALPELGKYTIGHDFASLLVVAIMMKKPSYVVEAGSGVSTVLAGYALDLLGTGQLVALENDEGYARQTEAMLREHRISPDVARVIEAPLCQHVADGEALRWYDTSSLDPIRPINLLVVDGPPRTAGRLSRYPVLPILQSHLADGAVILLDDAFRADERAALELWKARWPRIRVEIRDTQKGAATISWISVSTVAAS